MNYKVNKKGKLDEVTGFQELKLKISYDSDEDDILTDFLIPIMEKTINYKRLTGFFSSSSLLVTARGIAGLLTNKGRMQLITDANLREIDIQAIQAGEELYDVISRRLLEELENIEDEIVKDHIAALGWLVTQNHLKIKIVIMRDERGNIISSKNRRTMFHQKIGIFKDENGNLVSFSGSINESRTGWTGNIEEFKVYRSWEEGEKKYLEQDLDKFSRYWNGELKKGMVLDVPEAVKNKLIEIAPKSLDTMKSRLMRWYPTLSIRERLFPPLWQHQIEAISYWHKANHCGIWQMATGSGKTLAAIVSSKELFERIGQSLFVVIVCPYKVLIDQWYDELQKYGLKAWKLEQRWRKQLKEAINCYKWGKKDIYYLVSSYNKLPEFSEVFHSCQNSMIIADEVHNFGSPFRQKGMIKIIKYRLGLSATPERWFDKEGTKLIEEYFCEGTIYEFSMKEAINGQFLVPYDYYPVIVELTPDEMKNYAYFTRKIIEASPKNIDFDDVENLPENMKKFLIKRANIIKKAERKLPALKALITSRDFLLKKTLIYCSGKEEVRRVQNILNEIGIYQHQRFTEEESGNKKKRTQILNKFENGEISILVAIKCLDEGLDIPAVENAIIMASTSNPREFIQRRGRVLRKHSNKKSSTIFDLIVVPIPSYQFNANYRSIYERELKRYIEFSKLSRNPEVSAKILLELIARIKNI